MGGSAGLAGMTTRSVFLIGNVMFVAILCPALGLALLHGGSSHPAWVALVFVVAFISIGIWAALWIAWWAAEVIWPW